ncbi:MAG: hypothetical protein IPN24_03485 [Betaproteobacteria bacterium]|nr:hypothetical protein [Betaproteobacteria bacterium]
MLFMTLAVLGGLAAWRWRHHLRALGRAVHAAGVGGSIAAAGYQSWLQEQPASSTSCVARRADAGRAVRRVAGPTAARPLPRHRFLRKRRSSRSSACRSPTGRWFRIRRSSCSRCSPCSPASPPPDSDGGRSRLGRPGRVKPHPDLLRHARLDEMRCRPVHRPAVRSRRGLRATLAQRDRLC